MEEFLIATETGEAIVRGTLQRARDIANSRDETVGLYRGDDAEPFAVVHPDGEDR